MKEYLFLAKGMLIALTLFMARPVWSDMLVIDIDPPDTDTNPQLFTVDSNPVNEGVWLEGLLGMGADVLYLGKDGDHLWNDGIWSEGDSSIDWTYAVLKYGAGDPPGPDHWAIIDNNYNNIVDFTDIAGLPKLDRLSHITYFGNNSAPVPEPSTVLLLGTGLLGLTGFRKRLRKK